jgi:DNA end-binding protein Ku
LRLSLVSCPVLLYPATSEREKISFHQINSKTGNRVRLKRVDEKTGEEVPYDDIVKGYEVSKGHYLEVTEEELEAISIESTRTIDIDDFGVFRDAIEDMKIIALGRLVLTSA